MSSGHKFNRAIFLFCIGLNCGCIGGTNWDIPKARKLEGEARLASADSAENSAKTAGTNQDTQNNVDASGQTIVALKKDLANMPAQKATGKTGLAERLAKSQANSKNQALLQTEYDDTQGTSKQAEAQDMELASSSALKVTRPNAVGVAFLAAIVMAVVVGGIWLLLQPARKRSIWFNELKAKMGLGKTKSRIPIIEIPSAAGGAQNIAKKSRFRRKTSATLTGLQEHNNK